MFVDKSAASEALLKAIATPYPSQDPATPHPISLPHASRLYKLLLQGGHFSQQTKTVVRSELFSPLDFAQKFIDIVGQDATISLTKGDGVFLVTALCETVVSGGDKNKSLQKTLRTWFSTDVRKTLEADKEKRGMSTLLTQISALS